MKSDYRIRVSREIEDPEWDRFVSETPSAPYTQSSLWAQIKAAVGWQAARVVATRDDVVVGGTQLLYRTLPAVGSVGYIPWGPLPPSPEPELARFVLTHLLQMAADHRVRYLLLQPPAQSAVVDTELLAHGFRPSVPGAGSSSSVGAPEVISATCIIDLDDDLDVIQSKMHPKTRRNVRLGERKGLTVREGSQDDVSIFYRLLLGTGARRGFAANSEQYYASVCQVLGEKGCYKLFIAELGDEPVSANLNICLGDTFTGWRVGWSGAHARLFPNELLIWHAIVWAKANGYRYLDFGGLSLEVAQAVLRGESRTDWQGVGASFFKLGFGGRVVLLPATYECIPNPALRWLYSSALPMVGGRRTVTRAVDLVRGIGR